MAPPRITRPIPPPPVNKTSRPNFSPLSPSPLAPPRTPLRALQTDETERAESPDPRPVPPPSSCRNARDIDGDDEGPPPPPPRRSLPPPRRTSSGGKPYGSGEVTLAPPVPASPGPSIRRAMSPETTLVPEESMDDNVNEEESAATLPPTDADTEEKAEDEETARRKTIAERMAKLGGIRFGAPMPPPTARLPPPPQHTEQDQPNASDAEDVPEQTEEEEELARKQRIAAKLAGMGGMRFGMIPPSIPPSRKPLVLTRQEDSENEDALSQPLPVPAPQRAAPPVRPPPPPVASDSEQESRTTDDDGVRVEAEESEIEEVTYEDASGSEEEAPPPLPGREGRRAPVTPRSAEALPTPPPRMTSRSPPLPAGRPPVPSIPTTLLNRRPSIPVPAPKSPPSRKSSVHSVESRQSRGRESLSTDTTFRPQSEYVMVEAPSGAEVGAPPTPPKRPTRGPPPRMVPLPPPPPPSAVEPMSDSNQWELPSFSDAALDLALASDVDLESEEVSSRPVAPPLTKPRSRPSSQLPPMPSPKMAPERQLSSDELTAVWGKVGVQICEAATTLHEKSKKSLVGDGSYVGFVKAVLDQVPNALQPSSPDLEFGYLVYAQTADAVLRRASEIMPGDIIALYDARLKGHKGIQTYHQSVGVGEPLIGVVHEFETKKSKVRVYQANQHVGQQVRGLNRFARSFMLTSKNNLQTVESASYRLEDLKSGHVKVFRVLDSEV
ncbi:hypothetical protein BJ138DRAFT_1156731 [Hygrophoropsis aurantiaca]|uniref:Uncharacterized protein n=1 Tax=Hygrophoropsis aurantiaca TaxID=72124 RepID=A0ACB8A5T7_9AGAM|nr:hypothetical protein BJ138DRAFT_1156731 [Hygrophoropsis aurantiaca]